MLGTRKEARTAENKPDYRYIYKLRRVDNEDGDIDARIEEIRPYPLPSFEHELHHGFEPLFHRETTGH